MVNQAVTWQENGIGITKTIRANPELWGDVIVARKDVPTSYHLSVVVDDALQAITDVVRGRDLYQATSIHCLLQNLLDLPTPLYHHHRLVTDLAGTKLSKNLRSRPLRRLRAEGLSVNDIREQLELHPREDGL